MRQTTGFNCEIRSCEGSITCSSSITRRNAYPTLITQPHRRRRLKQRARRANTYSSSAMAILSKPLLPFPLLASLMSSQLPSASQASRKHAILILACILLLRSAPGNLFAKLKGKVAARKNKLTPGELAQALQQVYVTEADGTRRLLVPVENKYISKVSTLFRVLPLSPSPKSILPYLLQSQPDELAQIICKLK